MNRGLAGGASRAVVYLVVLLLAAACAPRDPGGTTAPGAADAPAAAPNPLRNAYFGDLHIHTRYSFDAFIFNVRATPDDAYRYAKGEAIKHPLGFDIGLSSGALDFMAVTDHSEYLGVLDAMENSAHPLSQLPLAKELFTEGGDPQSIRAAFQRVGQTLPGGRILPELDVPEVNRSAWKTIIEAAERHNQPGVFTAFVGYEYTSAPDQQNLHRNVIWAGSAVPPQPFTQFDSQNPEDLWRWMDTRRAEGMESLAIPHNSNGSNGQMFELVDWAGQPLSADYAALRMRNEPLVEVTQVKGTSETHPALSPNDEWAGFEIFPYRIATTLPSEPQGSYVREAYRHGLELEERGGANPYRFGLIGASDSHNAGGPVEESSYFSKVGAIDGTAERRGSVPLAGSGGAAGGAPRYAEVYYHWWGASGLAGVWAEENTRASLFAALRRRETYATSGPRLRVRFFAGFGFKEGLERASDMIERAYALGVPMGADLAARGAEAPRFLVWATRDPRSAPLQRLQVVKVWVADGASKERVFDVGCADGLAVDAATHRCPDNGATVDLASCAFSEDRGAPELRALWSDPTFAAGERAAYYVRVLENPTCRWSTWDALRAGVAPRPDLPATIQERAWSSPIWFVPAP